MIDLAASCPKAAGSQDRCVPLETTLELIPSLRAKYGITRVGNITRLDRIGIPTFCAIVPNSPTSLSVYNGKGTTEQAAIASAVFEAVEREAAASVRLPIRREGIARVGKLLDLDRLGLNNSKQDLAMDCVEAIDFLNERNVLVPLAILQSRRFEPYTFPRPTSNGLASGNTLIEAVYHALCELIERHAWSLYRMRCELLPRMLWGPDATDLGLASEVRMPSRNAALDAVAERVTGAGLHLRVMYLDDPGLPPVMLASIVEDRTAPPMSHIGLGCSLSPAHAAIRAIAEAAQSRLTDIQGAREDTLRVDDEPLGPLPEHTRRLAKPPKNRWFYDVPARAIGIGSIPDASTESLAEDVRRILSSLAQTGASSATIVDLSPRDIPVTVVRAIVPELETTCLDGRIGPKARNALNPFSTS